MIARITLAEMSNAFICKTPTRQPLSYLVFTGRLIRKKPSEFSERSTGTFSRSCRFLSAFLGPHSRFFRARLDCRLRFLRYAGWSSTLSSLPIRHRLGLRPFWVSRRTTTCLLWSISKSLRPPLTASSRLYILICVLSWLGTIFYLSYLIFEWPQTLGLQRFPAGKWMAGNILCWAVALSCQAACHNFAGLFVYVQSTPPSADD